MVFIATFLVAGSALAATQEVTPTRPPTTIVTGLGSCRAQSRQIDLRRVAFLENRSIDQDSPNGPVRISIEGETVNVEAIGAQSNRAIAVHDIGLAVEQGGDADIDLKLALLNGNLVIYWRETFQHRMYRQGLFNVALPDFVPLCEGRGGFDQSH